MSRRFIEAVEDLLLTIATFLAVVFVLGAIQLVANETRKTRDSQTANPCKKVTT